MLTGNELRQRLAAYREQNWKGVQTPEWQRKIVEAQLAADYRPAVQAILRQFSLGPNVRWLDVGSGIGDYVFAARRLGIEAYGIEPDRIGVGSSDSSLAIAKARWEQENIFVNGAAEQLPFADDTFDVLTLNQVVEHVQDVAKSLSESIRILRQGGILLISAPNYLSFYEPHYKLAWLPLFWKPLARVYLRLIGRDPAFLDGINYVTRARLRAILSRLPCRFIDSDAAHLRNLAANPALIRRRHVRLAIAFLKQAGMLNFAISINVNVFNRGINLVVTKGNPRNGHGV